MTQPDPIHDLEQTLARASREMRPETYRRFVEDLAAVANYAKTGGDLSEVETVLERDGADAARALVAARTA